MEKQAQSMGRKWVDKVFGKLGAKTIGPREHAYKRGLARKKAARKIVNASKRANRS